MVCADDTNIESILQRISRPCITYGFSEKADVQITEFKSSQNKSEFKINNKSQNKSLSIKLNMPGKHNALNVAAAATVALDEGTSCNVIETALKNFSDQAHKLGLLPGQANGMVKFYNEMTAASLQEQDSIAIAARENSVKELKQEWGQAYDQKISQANNLAKTAGIGELFDTNLADGTKLGDHPVMIKAFAQLAAQMGEDSITQSSGPIYQTPAQIEKEIGNLTQAGSAYWDKNNPNHGAAVEEVLALREKKNQV